MGRMAKNRKVEKSAETVWLNMVFQTHLKIKIGKNAGTFSAPHHQALRWPLPGGGWSGPLLLFVRFEHVKQLTSCALIAIPGALSSETGGP